MSQPLVWNSPPMSHQATEAIATFTRMSEPMLNKRLYQAPPLFVASVMNGLARAAPAGPKRKAIAKSPTMAIDTVVSP